MDDILRFDIERYKDRKIESLLVETFLMSNLKFKFYLVSTIFLSQRVLMIKMPLMMRKRLGMLVNSNSRAALVVPNSQPRLRL